MDNTPQKQPNPPAQHATPEVSPKSFLARHKLGLTLTVLLLALLAGAAWAYVHRELHAHDPQPVWEVTTGVALSEANALATLGTALPAGKPGDWDEMVKEIGSVLWDENTKQYLFYYSGALLREPATGVYVGLAVSKDGRTFTRAGRVLDVPSEDPYVVRHDGKYWMFYEDKSQVPFRKVDLACSPDGRKWAVVHRGVIQPRGESWQSADVSSPVVVQTSDGWAMLYEGRGVGSRGRLGIALAKHLAGPWTQERDYLLGGEDVWDHDIVPDDVVRQGDQYVLTYHGKPRHSSIAERLAGKQPLWQSGLAVSTDLRHWRRVHPRPISASATLMILRDPAGKRLRILAEAEPPVAVQTHRGVLLCEPARVSQRTPVSRDLR